MNDDLPGASPVQRMVRPAAEARWYSVSNSGQAMLCANEKDARRNAAISNKSFPFHAPYSAVQLVDVAAVAAERERCAKLVETQRIAINWNEREGLAKCIRELG